MLTSAFKQTEHNKDTYNHMKFWENSGFTSFITFLKKEEDVQSTLPKSNNRPSRRSIQVLFSLYSIVFNPL